MIRRLVSSLRAQNWSSALLELLVVALGILMAFQVDRWWEHRNDRELELEYIGRLRGDVERDIEALTFAIRQAELRRSFAALLMDVADDPAIAQDRPVDFLLAVNQAAFTYTPSLTSNTFEELKSTGRLGLIENIEVRDLLFDYYRYDEDQRQYQPLNLMQEFRHFELGAGILPNSLLTQMHLTWRVVNEEELDGFRGDPVDLDQVAAAAERLQQQTDFVNWLPIAHEMQTEILETNAERLERARHLLITLGQTGER